jgi:dihydrolipoamide dehydrogenase
MKTTKKKALIIGAGTGGYPCGIRLGQLGVDALLVEKDKPGGVCLNVGCIPSKALISASKLLARAAHADQMGISFGAPAVDMPKMQGWKQGITNKLTGGVKGLVKHNGCEYRQATATFLDRHRVQLTAADGSEEIIEAENVVVATGSVPIEIPGFAFDGTRILDSTQCLELDHVPEEMVVIGGGYIGLELGQTFQRLGAKLTVLEGLDRVLPTMDKDLGGLVARPRTAVRSSRALARPAGAKRRARLWSMPPAMVKPSMSRRTWYWSQWDVARSRPVFLWRMQGSRSTSEVSSQ